MHSTAENYSKACYVRLVNDQLKFANERASDQLSIHSFICSFIHIIHSFVAVLTSLWLTLYIRNYVIWCHAALSINITYLFEVFGLDLLSAVAASQVYLPIFLLQRSASRPSSSSWLYPYPVSCAHAVITRFHR